MIGFPRVVAERDVLATAKATVTDTATASREWPQKRIADVSLEGLRGGPLVAPTAVAVTA
jgi:hypothetical protein